MLRLLQLLLSHNAPLIVSRRQPEMQMKQTHPSEELKGIIDKALFNLGAAMNSRTGHHAFS